MAAPVARSPCYNKTIVSIQTTHRMKRILCLLALLCLFFKLPAQENQSDKRNSSGLAIGDQVPEVRITSILNHPTGEARISDYRGKWLILDFWATWCSPCIAMFPKTDSLQEVFKEEVAFLPVTYETESKVTTLFSKLKSLKGLHPPIVTEDSILNALFPHRSLPHYIWIDPEGTVAAITGHKDISYDNIKAMLKKGKAALTEKVDVMVPFTRLEPLLTGNKDMPKKPVLYQSVLMPHIEGLPSLYYATSSDSLTGRRIVATNATLPTLYKMAYGYAAGLYLNKHRILLEVADTTRFTNPSSGEAYRSWQRQGNAFCYELIVPPTRLGEEWLLMQKDLERYFPQYQAYVEVRKRPVLALVRTSREDKIASKGGRPMIDVKAYGAQVRNRGLRGLVLQLNAKFLQHLRTPVIDKTGYTGNVDLKLEATMSSVAEIRKAFQRYGLDLVEQQGEIEVLVIKDNKRKKNVGSLMPKP